MSVEAVVLAIFFGAVVGFFIGHVLCKRKFGGGDVVPGEKGFKEELDLAEEALKAAYVHLKRAKRGMDLPAKKDWEVYEGELHSLGGK